MAKNEVTDAAKKVADAEKKKDKKPANPNGNWFQRAGKAIKKFFKDLKGEIKKIVWPDAKTVVKSTLVVLAAVAICAAAIFAVDYVLSKAISLLELAAGKIGDATKVEEVAEEGLMTLRNFFLG